MSTDIEIHRQVAAEFGPCSSMDPVCLALRRQEDVEAACRHGATVLIRKTGQETLRPYTLDAATFIELTLWEEADGSYLFPEASFTITPA